MKKPREPVMCEECKVKMVPRTRDEPFESMPTTVSSTSPDMSASQYDYENLTEGEFPEWVEYDCPKCSRTKVIKVS